MLDKLIKMCRSALLYFIGNISSNLVSFFLLPLYTTYLTTEEYGNYDIIRTYITFMSSIIFMQIPTVVLRYMYDYKNKKIPITNAFFIFFLSGVFSFSITIIICYIFDIKYGLIISLFSLTESTSGFYGYIARGLGKNKLFAFSGFLSTLSNALTNILLIVIFKFSYSSLFISYIVGTIIQCLLIEIKLKPLRMIKTKYFSKNIIIDMYKFAIPFSMNICAFWFLNSYSRVIISSNLGVEQNGIYAVATKFTVALNLVSSCIIMAWQELAFEKGSDSKNKNQISIYYSKANEFYLLIMFLCTIFILPLIKLVFPLMVNGEFLKGDYIIPIALIATLLNIYSSFLTSIFSAIKQNNALFISTLIGAVVNIVFAHLLIGKFEVVGVTLANVAGFLINVIIRLKLLNKIMSLKIYIKKLIIPIIGVTLSLITYYLFSITINIIWLLLITVIIICTLIYLIKSKELYKYEK